MGAALALPSVCCPTSYRVQHKTGTSEIEPIAREPSIAASSSLRTKQAEKTRIRNLVNNFVDDALQGRRCVYVDESTGGRYPRSYTLDARLDNLMVVSSEDMTKAEITIPLMAIADIFAVEDGRRTFPPQVMTALHSYEIPFLCMIEYNDADGTSRQLFLVESSAESRIEFVEAVSILHLYVQEKSRSKEAEKKLERFID
mmetsp:Transcript_69199/g.150577  ORF Transcript_69199/g.150577 Transcript_69199/m.150577 type:complete len:200 (+) Transcript_69199:41-640(+)|eukprot:CAMPEP_0170609052 /NCGR_PEP_ID=MMETSP0224-20130122/21914_1 /TAXON_ID=285029 /ORGANISM="Togula jolla, Strain CCCM 725" /LENGTH=199 /DNA_ID=CAMNT_0010934323 /DNA_START=36 /DNA_END=635 /DNA_ORIENTATION=+